MLSAKATLQDRFELLVEVLGPGRASASRSSSRRCLKKYIPNFDKQTLRGLPAEAQVKVFTIFGGDLASLRRKHPVECTW
jgi:hypothetical protein